MEGGEGRGERGEERGERREEREERREKGVEERERFEFIIHTNWSSDYFPARFGLLVNKLRIF